MVLKELIFTVDTLGVVVLKELIFYQFPLWKGVVVLKELNFNSFHFGRSVVVFKKLNFNSFYFGKVWWS